MYCLVGYFSAQTTPKRVLSPPSERGKIACPLSLGFRKVWIPKGWVVWSAKSIGLVNAGCVDVGVTPRRKMPAAARSETDPVAARNIERGAPARIRRTESPIISAPRGQCNSQSAWALYYPTQQQLQRGGGGGGGGGRGPISRSETEGVL